MMYVTATDKFMSGWGHADGKINRLVFKCTGAQQAVKLQAKLDARPEMIRVNICENKPKYPEATHYTQYFDIESHPSWYA